MAKLFNKIRKQLVSDKPPFERTSNYLKYTIGEIVLVVIGILIVSNFKNNTKPLPSLEGIKGWVIK